MKVPRETNNNGNPINKSKKNLTGGGKLTFPLFLVQCKDTEIIITHNRNRNRNPNVLSITVPTEDNDWFIATSEQRQLFNQYYTDDNEYAYNNIERVDGLKDLDFGEYISCTKPCISRIFDPDQHTLLQGDVRRYHFYYKGRTDLDNNNWKRVIKINNPLDMKKIK